MLSRTEKTRYAGCVRRLVLNLLAPVLLPAMSYAAHEQAPATVSACFTPGSESCAEQIVDQIDAATIAVRVQAYYLTQPLILRAIAAAKKRGLDVEVILDKSQDRRTASDRATRVRLTSPMRVCWSGSTMRRRSPTTRSSSSTTAW